MEMRDAFISRLFAHARGDRNIVFLSNDFGAISLDQFREELPGQFINAGISEQNIISVAAGLASQQKRVFVYSIASFITLRCYEQIKIDLCTMRLPVTILGVGPCYGYGPDGPTHHATEDIAVMRALANMHIYSPSGPDVAESMVSSLLHACNPSYVRLDRGKWPSLYGQETSFTEGFTVLGTGTEMCIVATGIMTHRALEVAEMLGQNSIGTSVIDVHCLKPIPGSRMKHELSRYERIITVEEHTINGGLGSIIVELLADAGLQKPVRRFAISDELLYAYGKREELHFERRLDKLSIAADLQTWANRGGR